MFYLQGVTGDAGAGPPSSRPRMKRRASIGQRTFLRATNRHFDESFKANLERLFGTAG